MKEKIKIKAKDLKLAAVALQPGETITVDFPEAAIKEIELLNLQTRAADALFTAYINNTNEAANEFNLAKFLALYSNMVARRGFLFQDNAARVLGREVYTFCTCPASGVTAMIDFGTRKLSLRRIMNNSATNIE